MKLEIYECETCKKRTKEHFYDETGWIVIEGKSILITKGRRDDGCADSIYKAFSTVYLCSEKCFLKWIKG